MIQWCMFKIGNFSIKPKRGTIEQLRGHIDQVTENEIIIIYMDGRKVLATKCRDGGIYEIGDVDIDKMKPLYKDGVWLV